ncbi:cation transporter [Alteromonas aestuariivivens]|uniref:Cation transporter n=1 Tax=Alteromonas aestuariivivens TaxID=1938339 RepID=A0A3D8M4W3_9ALTE|nr:Na+/H+ antiporter subunit E [Alteromonas aestuariivivens]RDV24648.1 cation transporter [Alteromonas aestuariivivens]
MAHKLRLFLTLFALWLLLSGHYNALMLGFGGISVAFVCWLTLRMDSVDKQHFVLPLTPAIPVYLARLSKRIVLSNIDVILRIMGLRPLTPRLVELSLPFSDPLNKVIYANAITLTPGSASITMSDNKLLVHTLSDDSARDLLLGDMLSIMPFQSTEQSLSLNKGEG